MAENERMLREMEKKWSEKLADAEKENREKDDLGREEAEMRKYTAHIYNLSPDPMLCGMIVHLLRKSVNTIGGYTIDFISLYKCHLDVFRQSGKERIMSDGVR